MYKNQEITAMIPNPVEYKNLVCISKQFPSFTSHYFLIHIPSTNLSVCHFQTFPIQKSQSNGPGPRTWPEKYFVWHSVFKKYLNMNVFWGKGNILSNYPSPHTNSVSLIYNTCLAPEDSGIKWQILCFY